MLPLLSPLKQLALWMLCRVAEPVGRAEETVHQPQNIQNRQRMILMTNGDGACCPLRRLRKHAECYGPVLMWQGIRSSYKHQRLTYRWRRAVPAIVVW